MESYEIYNYDEFVPKKFERWMWFDHSPALGSNVDNFILWDLEGTETCLTVLLNQSVFTVVEFGSFT